MKKERQHAVLIARNGWAFNGDSSLSGKREILDGATLVLQPQSDLPSVRGWLAEEGYAITAEDLVLEDGKYYPMMRAQKCRGRCQKRKIGIDMSGNTGSPKIMEETQKNKEVQERGMQKSEKHDDTRLNMKQAKEKEEQELRYGPLLLEKKHPLLAGYLDREETLYRNVLTSLEGKDTEGAVARRTEIAYELRLIAGVRERLKEVK